MPTGYRNRYSGVAGMNLSNIVTGITNRITPIEIIALFLLTSMGDWITFSKRKISNAKTATLNARRSILNKTTGFPYF